VWILKYTNMKKIRTSIALLIVIIILCGNYSFAQIDGCTDQNANNFNPLATENNGSCTYNVTLSNPLVKYLLPNEINETSGLSYFNGKLWTINDSGGLPILYAFDTISGEIMQRITVSGATNIDWESLADDEEYIYIGDFGNNSGNRDDLAIYKVNKTDIPEFGDAIVSSAKIEFSYADYTGNIVKRKENNFDCEAFFAFNNKLYLFSKNHGNQESRLYKLSSTSGSHIAELIDSFNTAGLITGADINLDENEVTLVGYIDQTWVPFVWLLFDYSGDGFFSGNKRRIDFPNIIATQTEAIVYTHGKNEVVTSEGNLLFSQSAYDFESSQWTEGSPSSLTMPEITPFNFTLSPNPVKRNKLNMDISNLPAGEYLIEVYDNLGNIIDSSKYTENRMNNSVKIKIKIGSYLPGIYFVRMSAGNDKIERKFIKR
jgi:type IX secretion system substrate protein